MTDEIPDEPWSITYKEYKCEIDARDEAIEKMRYTISDLDSECDELRRTSREALEELKALQGKYDDLCRKLVENDGRLPGR